MIGMKRISEVDLFHIGIAGEHLPAGFSSTDTALTGNVEVIQAPITLYPGQYGAIPLRGNIPGTLWSIRQRGKEADRADLLPLVGGTKYRICICTNTIFPAAILRNLVTAQNIRFPGIRWNRCYRRSCRFRWRCHCFRRNRRLRRCRRFRRYRRYWRCRCFRRHRRHWRCRCFRRLSGGSLFTQSASDPDTQSQHDHTGRRHEPGRNTPGGLHRRRNGLRIRFDGRGTDRHHRLRRLLLHLPLLPQGGSSRNSAHRTKRGVFLIIPAGIKAASRAQHRSILFVANRALHAVFTPYFLYFMIARRLPVVNIQLSINTEVILSYGSCFFLTNRSTPCRITTHSTWYRTERSENLCPI